MRHSLVLLVFYNAMLAHDKWNYTAKVMVILVLYYKLEFDYNDFSKIHINVTQADYPSYFWHFGLF